MAASEVIASNILADFGRRLQERVERRTPKGTGRTSKLWRYVIRDNTVIIVGPLWKDAIERGRGPLRFYGDGDYVAQKGPTQFQKRLADWISAKGLSGRFKPSSLAYFINRDGTRLFQRYNGEVGRDVFSSLPDHWDVKWMEKQIMKRHFEPMIKRHVEMLRAAAHK